MNYLGRVAGLLMPPPPPPIDLPPPSPPMFLPPLFAGGALYLGVEGGLYVGGNVPFDGAE